MSKNCNALLKSALPIVFVAILAGCSAEKSHNPLSPSIAGPIQSIVISAYPRHRRFPPWMAF